MAFPGQQTQSQQQDRSYVQFYRRALQNNFESEQQGRPVFDEFDFVKVMVPGQDKSITDRKVTDADKVRWTQQWQSYLQGREQVAAGTPLSEWPQLAVSDVARLQSLHIHTVEALAELTDEGCQRVGPGSVELRKRAQYWLSESVPKSAAAGLQAANDGLREDNERLNMELARAKNDLLEGTKSQREEMQQLREALADAQVKIEQLEAGAEGGEEPAKRGPGRPRKS